MLWYALPIHHPIVFESNSYDYNYDTRTAVLHRALHREVIWRMRVKLSNIGIVAMKMGSPIFSHAVDFVGSPLGGLNIFVTIMGKEYSI